MRTISNRTFVNTFIIIALLIFTATSIFAYLQVKNLLRDNRLVVHTYQVMDEARKIQFSLDEARNSLNPAVTPETAPLQEINAIEPITLSHLQNLFVLLKNNINQQKKIAPLKHLVETYFILLKKISITPHNPSIEEITAVTQSSKQLIKKIEEILHTEQNLLNERENQVKHAATRTIFIIASSTITAGLLIVICLILLNYHLRKLTRSEREKSEAEVRQRLMINSSSDLISAVDTSLCLIAFNTAFKIKIKKLFGYDIKIGDSLNNIFSESTYKNEIMPAWQTALDGEETTITTRLSNKEDVFYEITINTTHDNQNRIIGASSIMRNITARVKVDQLKNEFVSIVSHELRTPLTSIRGSLGLLLGGTLGTLNEKSEKMLQIALNNSERLIQLINDILDIEKIESGKMDFKYSVFNIDDVIEESIIATESYAKKYNVKISFSKNGAGIFVEADRNRLIQVLVNLISNAAKFSPSGGTITIYTQLEGTLVKVLVHDQGQGVDEEFRKHIFEKFAQADSSSIRVKGGTGLGLSICKMIIEKLGGRIGFDSDVGNTTFYFELPTYTKLLPDTTTPTKNLSIPAIQHSKLNILHLEDDTDVSEIVNDVLKNDAHVTNVKTLSEALTILDNKKFDIVILDLMLKNQSSMDIIPKIAERNIPIVIFSAYEIRKDYAHLVKEILVKSQTSNEELLRTIRQIGHTTA